LVGARWYKARRVFVGAFTCFLRFSFLLLCFEKVCRPRYLRCSMLELTTRSPSTQPNSVASKAPVSKAAKAPVSSVGQQRAARKAPSKEDGDMKKKRKKARRETYSSYIYKGVYSPVRFRLYSDTNWLTFSLF